MVYCWPPDDEDDNDSYSDGGQEDNDGVGDDGEGDDDSDGDDGEGHLHQQLRHCLHQWCKQSASNRSLCPSYSYQPFHFDFDLLSYLSFLSFSFLDAIASLIF